MIVLDYCSDGLPIQFDEATAEIIYKDIRVSFFAIKSAVESSFDRVQLTENLNYTSSGGFVTFGCLTLTENKVKQLTKTVWKQLKTCNKVGN